MATAFIGERRAPFFRDRDGAMSVSKHLDEVTDVTLDWTDRMGSDTISASTWTADGPTIANATTSGLTTTVQVSGSGGTLKNTVEGGSGQFYVQEFKVYESPTVSTSDY